MRELIIITRILFVLVGSHAGFRIDALVCCMVFVGSDSYRVGCFTCGLATKANFVCFSMV